MFRCRILAIRQVGFRCFGCRRMTVVPADRENSREFLDGCDRAESVRPDASFDRMRRFRPFLP